MAAGIGPNPRHEQIRILFERLAEMPMAEQASALEALDIDEQEKAFLRRLLAGNRKDRLFGTPIVDWVRELDGDVFIESLIGRRIGSCELVRQIGRGGSAVVFFAQRAVGDTLQPVALKLLHTGLLSEEAHRRFRREQAALSRLTHPNIARLIDAGLSDTGNPFLVMEFVDGTDLIAHASTRSLDVRTRVRLLIDTCRAIDAAHRELVVHRDLKPSNVIVTADGIVKVLDFGIAKFVDDDTQTATQHIALTPAYAAPEQFRAAPATTAMDIYSLGVLASELLIGCRLGEDAVLPSQASAEVRRRWRRLDPDLVTILRAALAGEPRRRYSSAGHMADDFVRYLKREPLHVAPVSGGYRLRKFVSRHRGGVSASVLAVAMVLGGSALALHQRQVARVQAELAMQQAALAREQARRAQEARNFLVSVFEAGSAEAPREQRPSIEDIVASANRRLLADETLSTDLRADLLLTLADVASSVGAVDRSERILDAVDELVPRLGDGADETALQVRVRRAGNMAEQWSPDGRKILDLLEPVMPALAKRTDRIALSATLYRAKALQIMERADEAQAAVRELVARYRDSEQHEEALAAMAAQLNIAVEAQRYPQALEAARVAIDYWQRTGRPRTPIAMGMWGSAAIAREAAGDTAGAEQAYRSAIDIADEVYEHPTLFAAGENQLYGSFLVAQSRLDEAEKYVRRAVQLTQAIFGLDDPRTAQAVYGMARWHAAKFDHTQAIQWATRAIDLYRKADHDSVMLARSLALRARVLASSGQQARADADLRDALAMQKRLGGENGPGYIWVLDFGIDVQLCAGRFAEALRTADRVLAFDAGGKSQLAQAVLVTRYKRAVALTALGRWKEAIVELDEIAPAYDRLAPRSALRAKIALARADALARAHRAAEATRVAQEALQDTAGIPFIEPRTRLRLQRFAASAMTAVRGER